MHFLSIYGSIGSFYSESVDFQYFQLSEALPSAKIKEHTKTHVSQPFGLPIPWGIPSGGRGSRKGWGLGLGYTIGGGRKGWGRDHT